MIKKASFIFGIILYIYITIIVFKDIYKTFAFFKPLFALLNFGKITYCWGAFTYGFIDGYFFYHKREEKLKKEQK